MRKIFPKTLEQRFELLEKSQNLKMIERKDLGLLVHLFEKREYK